MESNNLILVLVGESGSGKSFIQKEILSKYPNIAIIKKYTTRKSRIDENGSVETQSNMAIDSISEDDYSYINPTNHELYWFRKKDIETALLGDKIPVVAPSSEECYLKILNDYSDKRVLLLKVLAYYDEETMKESFDKQGRDSEEFEKRKILLKNPITDWVYEYNNMHVIVNPYFLRSCPPDVSKGVIIKRFEDIMNNELKVDLGAKYTLPDSRIRGCRDYLYTYSKNRPKDEKLNFDKKRYI